MEQVQQQIEKPKEETANVDNDEKKPQKAAAPVEKIVAAPKEPAKPTSGVKAKVDEKKDVKEEKKREIVLKRTVTVSLFDAYAKPAKKRAAKAVKMLRKYASRHAKATEANVKIDQKLAAFINARGSKKPPKKLKVLLAKDKQGLVTVSPA